MADFQVADRDGFILGKLQALSDGGRGVVALTVEDANGELHTARASVHRYSGSDAWVRYQSILLPIAKGRKWKIEITDEDASPQVDDDFIFIPLTNYTENPNAGFFLGSIRCDDGGRGIIEASAGGHSARASAHHYGPSDAWVRWNSVLIPADNDAHGEVKSYTNPGDGDVENPTIEIIKDYMPFKFEQGDGFQCAEIRCEDGGRAIVELSLNRGGRKYVARASAHHYGTSDVWVRYNTVFLPKKVGDSISIKLLDDDRAGVVDLREFFIPFRAST